MKAFREAVEARDLAAVTALLAPDVEFNSPVSHKPYRGRDMVGWILATVATVFEDFTYVDELASGGHSALRFRTRVGDRQAEGVDLIECNADGQIEKLTVMIRPLSALQALADAMAARFAARSG
jgi:SnoaL-like domain